LAWVDLHSHILPGLDDGARDLETSLQLCEGLYRLGWGTLVATPHVSPAMWDGSPGEVMALAQVVEEALLERLRPPGNGGEVEISIGVGGEHMLDANFLGRLERDQLLEYPRGRGVLVEVSLSPGATHPGLRDILFRIRIKGIKPVFAHPERYDAAHQSLAWVEQLRDDGVAMLGDLTSLVDRSGRKSRKVLEKLIDRDLIDGLATDIHHPDDLRHVEKALLRLEKLVGGEGMEDYLTWGRQFVP
jgi:protein-tyrosine phosphatase